MRKSITHWMEKRVDAIGFASIDRFHDAPEEHHPSRVLDGARTVIVFGRAVPRGLLKSPSYGLHLLHRSYHTLYPYLDDIGLDLANIIEKEGYLAVQIPSYAPMVYHGMEPWGILSLKHAAVLAGLGNFGRSGLVYHPQHGSLLRLGAVVTNAEIPPDPVDSKDPCPPECRACQVVCPAGAFENGSFKKMKCLTFTIRHGIYPIALRDEMGRKNIEIIINTAGYNYWIKCQECQKVCPLNRREGQKMGEGFKEVATK